MKHENVRKIKHFICLFFILLTCTSTMAAIRINSTGVDISLGNSNQVYVNLSTGSVGIGNTTPTHSFVVAGNISFANGPKIIDNNGSLTFRAGGTVNGSSGNANIYFTMSNGTVTARLDTNATGTNYGNFFIGTSSTLAADLAEYYMTTDQSITSGDLVSLTSTLLENGEITGSLTKSTLNDKNLIGVISLEPGYLIGNPSDSSHDELRMLALAGRTPVKVSTENGPITIGDSLTSSSIPGVAMKATAPSLVIGRSLEKFNEGTKCKEWQCGKVNSIVWTAKEKSIETIQDNQEKIDLIKEKTLEIEKKVSLIEALIK